MQNAQFAKFSIGVCDFWPIESYVIRGWDREGRPTIEKLKNLGIEDKFIGTYAVMLNNQKKRGMSPS